jgi:hypothetical protein
MEKYEGNKSRKCFLRDTALKGLVGVVLGASALGIGGCNSNSWHEVFRNDEKKNMSPLADPVYVDYKKYDDEHKYDIVNDRAYLKGGPKPESVIEKTFSIEPYERTRILNLNATYTEDGNNLILQYHCRTPAPDLTKRLSNYSKEMLPNISMETSQNDIVFSGKKESFGDFSNLTKLLNEFDKATKQVRVRLKVVEIFYDNTYDRELVISALKGGTEVVSLNLPSNPDPSKTLTAGGMTNPFYNAKSNSYSIESALKFLDSYGRTKTLSDTDQIVTNGEQTQFKNLTNIPYTELLEGKSGFLETIKYRDTGTTILITPFANEEGYITLKVDVKSGEQTGFFGTEQRPVFREADFVSNFTVKNGTPYLAANSITSRYKSVQRGIPLISKTPILKDVFSSRSIENSQSQLLYFIEAREIGRESPVGIMKIPRLQDTELSNKTLEYKEEDNAPQGFNILFE